MIVSYNTAKRNYTKTVSSLLMSAATQQQQQQQQPNTCTLQAAAAAVNKKQTDDDDDNSKHNLSNQQHVDVDGDEKINLDINNNNDDAQRSSPEEEQQQQQQQLPLLLPLEQICQEARYLWLSPKKKIGSINRMLARAGYGRTVKCLPKMGRKQCPKLNHQTT